MQSVLGQNNLIEGVACMLVVNIVHIEGGKVDQKQYNYYVYIPCSICCTDLLG